MTGEQRNPCPISEVSFLNVCKLQPFEEAHIDMPSYPVVRYRAEVRTEDEASAPTQDKQDKVAAKTAQNRIFDYGA